MDKTQSTTAYLLAQCALYPALQPQDLLKALHQSVFGCGHFIQDESAARSFLQEELAALSLQDGPVFELLDGDFCRFHLRALEESGLSPETLLRLFILSAEVPCGSAEELEEKLAVLLSLAQDGRLPFSYAESAAAVDSWRQQGFPACHHSPAFRAAYAPAYRVIRKDFLRWLPLLAAIDQKSPALVAIEGGSASGKTTLAALLARIYPCNVFHMDDYFLQPKQRTAERLDEPGGNVDRERFYEEILLPLTQHRPVAFRRYDCHTQTLQPPTVVPSRALNIVEGAYSMHPLLANAYDLSVFLRVSPEVQRRRIGVRNDPETAERFFSTWIPLEHRYFDALDVPARCDMILEVDA